MGQLNMDRNNVLEDGTSLKLVPNSRRERRADTTKELTMTRGTDGNSDPSSVG